MGTAPARYCTFERRATMYFGIGGGILLIIIIILLIYLL